MKKLRHPIGGFVVFSILVLLLINIYTGLEDHYSITKGDIKTINGTTGNIADQLKEIPLVQGVSQITAGVSALRPGGGSTFDILGGLASVGLGALKTSLGVFIFPYSITNILVAYYSDWLPAELMGILALIIVYAAFIMLSAYLGRDV